MKMLFKFVDCIFWFFISIAYCLGGGGGAREHSKCCCNDKGSSNL